MVYKSNLLACSLSLLFHINPSASCYILFFVHFSFSADFFLLWPCPPLAPRNFPGFKSPVQFISVQHNHVKLSYLQQHSDQGHVFNTTPFIPIRFDDIRSTSFQAHRPAHRLGLDQPEHRILLPSNRQGIAVCVALHKVGLPSTPPPAPLHPSLGGPLKERTTGPPPPLPAPLSAINATNQSV